MAHTVVADQRGRLLLPKDLREHLGLAPGTAVVAELDGDGNVILRDARAQLEAQIEQARGIARDAPGSVGELIAERRRQARDDQR